MLTRDRNTPERAGDILVLPVAGNAVIHAGALVVINAGYAAPGSTAANLRSAGRADEAVDNTGGADGAQSIRVRRGVFKWKNSATDPIGTEHLLGDAYIEDDETVAATDGGGTRSKAGKILGVDSDGVWVEIR